MKRFLTFALIGPIITIALLTAYEVARVGASNPALAAAGYVVSPDPAKVFVILTLLAAWLGDVALIHWRVELPKRVFIIAGGMMVLTVSLQTSGMTVLVAGLVCGSVAALCVWLSEDEEQGRQDA